MAFIDEQDLRREAPPAPPAPPARRSLLVPALLITLNVAVLALLVIFAAPKLGLTGTEQQAPEGTAQLDPAMLVTPTGRRLDVKEFGGFVFEVTRITYSGDAALRSVTITVPGNPPRQGVFRIRDSFAGGAIRVADISSASVILEHNGEQRTFMVDGSDPGEVWDRQPTGLQMIPARNSGAFPDVPAGQSAPPKAPVAEQPEEPEEPAGPGIPEGLTLEELPEERHYALPRKEFELLSRTIADMLEKEFVFGKAIDPDSRIAYAARVLNLRGDSIFYTHGLRAGDDIVSINDTDVHHPDDIPAAARQATGASEIKVVIWRGDETIAFIFTAGPSD